MFVRKFGAGRESCSGGPPWAITSPGWLILIAALLSGVPPLWGKSWVSLIDLDLSRMQNAQGPAPESEMGRTEGGGVVLRAGSSLWVDLKGSALELEAEIEPLAGSRGGPVRCRFVTANHFQTFVMAPGDPPKQVKLRLEQQPLLIIDSKAVGTGPGVSVHIRRSSIAFATHRPETWGGGSPIRIHTPVWDVSIDGRSGGISELSHPGDRFHMQWVRPGAVWGSGWLQRNGERWIWDRPSAVRTAGPGVAESVYDLPGIRLRVIRGLDARGRLREQYEFENTSGRPLSLGAGELAIRVPLPDNYPSADLSLRERCHVHVWTGGTSSYLFAVRMGGSAPHLGLVLTEGALDSYSIVDRIWHSNDRGQIAVHPAAMTLEPGEKRSVSWTLFWHEGAADFHDQVDEEGSFIRLEADRYTVAWGERIQVRAKSTHPPRNVRLLVNGEAAAATWKDGQVQASLPAATLGEQYIELLADDRRTWLRAFVSLPPMELIRNRVRFILEHQQRRAPGDPLDGAYLVYDNEAGKAVHDPAWPDHNAGRERLAMGVLLARYYPHCDDAALKDQIARSLASYAAFVRRELQGMGGIVYNGPGRAGPLRLYNFPWVAQFHLAMDAAFQDRRHLRQAVDTVRAYYERGGGRFYCIGMPVTALLDACRSAGWENERKEMLARFRKHAETLAELGEAYPAHEVNFEQSIVGPAAQLLLEVYLAGGSPRLLSAAEQQLRILELFSGRQPDHHLHEIAIRHWDDYWFGKRKLYGDTFPHYWSTISGAAYAFYARASGKSDYLTRARAVVENNFSLFAPDGRGFCAYVYPRTVNGQPGSFYDPWANDQDWALVVWLDLFGPSSRSSSN